MVNRKKQGFSFLKVIPFIFLLLGLVLFFYFGLHEYVNFETLKKHRKLLLGFVNENYTLTTFIFIFSYIILVAISAPGAIYITLFGGFVFGIVLGTFLVVIGATIGATVIFIAAKTAFHDLFEKKAGKLLNKIAKGFHNNAISYMFFLRLVPIFPFWLVNIVPALLGITLRTYIFTTFFGIIPGTFVYVMLGNGLGVIFDQDQTPDFRIIYQMEILLPIVCLAMLSLIPIVYKRFKK